jgi:hypothetical protein
MRDKHNIREKPRRAGRVECTASLPKPLLRMQDEFLHAPVEELADVQRVLGGTRDLVDPTELLELLARFASTPSSLPSRLSL